MPTYAIQNQFKPGDVVRIRPVLPFSEARVIAEVMVHILTPEDIVTRYGIRYLGKMEWYSEFELADKDEK